MNIYINGKAADITLDTEKTLGNVLSGLEQWVSQSGSRLQSISVDGEVLDGEALSQAFGRNISAIKKLDVLVSPYRELAEQALSALLAVCLNYEGAAFEGRAQIAEEWKQSAAADFLHADVADMYELASIAFAGEGLAVRELAAIIEDRLMEIAAPAKEIAGCEVLVKTVAARMEELSLDMQTGKDERAAETIQLFSQAGQKLFRIFFILESEGLDSGPEGSPFAVDGVPAKDFMKEFNAVLAEISAAYENKDTVLAGDLSEYELAPRLLKFYYALKDLFTLSP
ncbi:MAG: hypothetical protein FWD91_04145 [Treponema sp.]|nr:hypothetical protein [Treponema sp.]